MRMLRRFFQRLLSPVTARQDEARLRAEIEEHLALQTDENVRSGLSLLEARRQAALKFGSVAAVSDTYRETHGMPFLETLLMDVWRALRRLVKAPSFAATVLLTLALGIGAITSIFTLAHAVLLKSLAVANPKELYRLGKQSRCCYLGGYSQKSEFSLVSYDLYKYLRDHTQGFSELAAFPATRMLLGVHPEGRAEPAQSYPGEFVSGNYFSMFGVSASVGRALTPQDDRPSAPPVAMMSYRLWQQRFGADPSVIGSVFDLNNKPFTIVGVTPPVFYGDTLRNTPPDFFLPLNTEPYVEPDADLNDPATHWLEIIGRLRPGVQPASVEAQMRVALKQWLYGHWGEMSTQDRALFPSQTLYLRPGGGGITSMREQYERWLHILLMVSAFSLLIVCANLANLLLVRGLEQRRQTALSMALGAKPARLVRQTITECLLLSLLGGALGLCVSYGATSAILHFAFPKTADLAAIPIDASPSLPVLAFTFVASLLTGLIFGVAPAWMTIQADPIEALRGYRVATQSGSAPRKLLVGFQAALSLVLLVSSGLLTAALMKLQHTPLGFDEDHRIVASINPRLAGYRPEQLSPLYRRIYEALSNLPGVADVALCSYSPLGGGNWGSGVWVEGRPSPTRGADNSASRNRVTAGYFEVIGTPIARGRGILEQDTAASRHVAVINEAFARKFFPGENAIGKHFGRDSPGSERQYEIVGVAKDAYYQAADLTRSASPAFFLPEAQYDLSSATGLPEKDGTHFMGDIILVTKPGATLAPAALIKAMASVDPKLPIISTRTLSQQIAGQFTQQRLIAQLTSFFGVLSLVLASIGLYGITAYSAGCRVNEIGVRMALGADRGQVLVLILRDALFVILAGFVAGLPVALAAGRLLNAQLYGINPYDPRVLVSALLALGLATFLAALLPALRAASISPLNALRTE